MPAHSWLVALLPVLAAISLHPTAPATAGPLPLAGRVVTLDPGHNGGNAAAPRTINKPVDAGNGVRKPCNTVGTATNGGYPEHRLNYEVATRAAALLRRQGATVHLTRSSDSGVGPCIDVRAAIGNRSAAHAVVSIHADGNHSQAARGFHVIHPSGRAPSAAVKASSERLALTMRDAFRRTTALPYATYLAGGDGIMGRADLGGLNLTTRPTIFLEMGNMRHAADAAVMTSPVGRQRLAAGVAAGVADYLRA